MITIGNMQALKNYVNEKISFVSGYMLRINIFFAL